MKSKDELEDVSRMLKDISGGGKTDAEKFRLLLAEYKAVSKRLAMTLAGNLGDPMPEGLSPDEKFTAFYDGMLGWIARKMDEEIDFWGDEATRLRRAHEMRLLAEKKYPEILPELEGLPETADILARRVALHRAAMDELYPGYGERTPASAVAKCVKKSATPADSWCADVLAGYLRKAKKTGDTLVAIAAWRMVLKQYL